MRGHPERTELGLGADDTWAESCCERVEGQTKEGGAGLGVCYGLPDREVDKVFYGQWSRGDCNHPDICWRNGTARHKQSRRLLASTDGNLLTRVVQEPEGRGVQLNLVPTNKEGLLGEVEAGSSPGGRYHGAVELCILPGESRAVRSQPWTPGVLNWASSRTFLEESNGNRSWKGAVSQESWLIIQRWLPAASRLTTRCATTAPSAAAAPQHSAPPTQRCTPNTAAWRWEGQRSLSGLTELSAPTSCVGKQARAKRTSPPPQQT